MRDKPRWEIIHGDSLTVLESFPPGTFDAVITDPPYASGGRTQAEKSKATAKKYSSMGGNAPPDFDGDAKDQRSWTRWAAEGGLDLARDCRVGQGKLPSAERTFPPAGRIHCLGFERRHAGQPPCAVFAGCVQIRQSAEPHPPDRKAVAAHAGSRQDHGTGRSYLGPLCRLRHDSSGCSQGRL